MPFRDHNACGVPLRQMNTIGGDQVARGPTNVDVDVGGYLRTSVDGIVVVLEVSVAFW